MLEVKNVHKSFDGKEILKGISLQVEKGDVVAILGPSGSGKTTLLRCMNFLEKADQGTIIFDGEEVDLKTAKKHQIADIRKKTAFVFQNYNLFQNKTVLQNVTLGLTSGMGMDRKQAEGIALEALQKVGMADRLDSFPSQLSGGQQQRVAIARGVSHKVLFMDDGKVIESRATREFFQNPTTDRAREFVNRILSSRED